MVFTFIRRLSYPNLKEGKAQNLNNFLLKAQLKILQTILNIHNPVLFFSTPLYGKAIDFIKHEKSFYYYSDKYTEARVLDGEGKKLISNLDKLLYTKCDELFCASKLLTEYVSEKSGREAHYLPHGVDVDFFMDEDQKRRTIGEMEKINKPICGYFGTLTVSNDWELLKYCAEKRPGYNFVFIGRKEIMLEEIEKMNNVFFLGKRDYSDIPAFGNYFDVCLNFWVMKDWIKNSSPLKIKEYLALGKPVVSTEIEEITNNFADVVFLSSNKEEFLENLDRAVNSNNEDRINKGLEKVKNESWVKAAEKIEELIYN